MRVTRKKLRLLVPVFGFLSLDGEDVVVVDEVVILME